MESKPLGQISHLENNMRVKSLTLADRRVEGDDHKSVRLI